MMSCYFQKVQESNMIKNLIFCNDAAIVWSYLHFCHTHTVPDILTAAKMYQQVVTGTVGIPAIRSCTYGGEHNKA